MPKVKSDLPVTHSGWWKWTLRTRTFLLRGPKTATQIMKMYKRSHHYPQKGLFNHLAWMEHHGHAVCHGLIWSLTPLGVELHDADRAPKEKKRKSIKSHVERICAKYQVEAKDVLGLTSVGPSVMARDELCAYLLEDGWDVSALYLQTGLDHERIKKAAERYYFRLATRGQA